MSKTIYFIVFALMYTYAINAQVNKKAIQAGGNFSIDHFTRKDSIFTYNSTGIIFQPQLGYYIIDNLGIGVNLFLQVSIGNNFTNTYYGFGPWARYYAHKGLFIQGGYRYTYSITKPFSSSNSQQTNLSLGWSYWLNNSIAIEPKIFYNLNLNKDDRNREFTSHQVGLSIGLQVFLQRN